MNILDWVLICAGAFWVLRGLARGAVSQIFGIAGILAGFLVAVHHYLVVSAFISAKFHSISGPAVAPVSFIGLFLLTWFCVAVAGSWITTLLRGAGLGFIDRLWGAMIGFAKAALFAIVTISVLTLFSTGPTSSLIKGSKLAPMIMETSRFLYKLAPPKVQQELSRKQQELEKILSDRTSNLLDSFLGHRADSGDPGEKGGKRNKQ
ncbi:MAG TPA: CvpA family protein [Syntrophobacteraceae bacterium]|nr:CvpA family protein [Syntrophobacteraceae bacterium]